jgi:hypothetical protein
MNAGNATTTPLAGILPTVTQLAATIPARTRKCEPDACFPEWSPCRPDTQCPPGRSAAQDRASTQACNPNCVPDSYCDPLCIPGACKPRT